MTRPAAKLPSFNVPTMRSLPSIPNVGCVPGSATAMVGSQFGNFPDIQALPHVRAFNKVITEQIGTLIEGKLGDIPRAAAYEIRRARLVIELQNIVQQGVAIAEGIQAEVNANINALNGKIADLNAAKNAVLAIPENSRSALQRKTLDRLNSYIGELDAQKSRLQTSLGCLT